MRAQRRLTAPRAAVCFLERMTCTFTPPLVTSYRLQKGPTTEGRPPLPLYSQHMVLMIELHDPTVRIAPVRDATAAGRLVVNHLLRLAKERPYFVGAHADLRLAGRGRFDGRSRIDGRHL